MGFRLFCERILSGILAPLALGYPSGRVRESQSPKPKDPFPDGLNSGPQLP